MLTARNVIVASIVIAVLSMAGVVLSLLGPRDQGGMAGGTYGTRAHGQRALFDILTELNVPVERVLGPPSEVLAGETTLVFWKPDPGMVSLEPTYLQSVAKWVEDGGRVVVTPAPPGDVQIRSMFQSRTRTVDNKSADILSILGLENVEVQDVEIDPGVSTIGARSASPVRFPGVETSEGVEDDVEGEPNVFGDVYRSYTDPAAAIRTVSAGVHADGELVWLNSVVTSLKIPESGCRVIDSGDRKPDGTLTFETEDSMQHILAAVYRMGRGKITVVAEPSLLLNRGIADEDNSVLAVHLLAGSGDRVLFDEFYHGLTIRSNPFWLLTQRTYAALTFAILAVIGVLAWRQSLFLGPPLDRSTAPRRTIGEYIEAMARFLNRGKSSRPFLLREVRDGVFWKLRHELNLKGSRDRPEEIAAAIARSLPERAKQFTSAVGRVDKTLAKHERIGERETVDRMRRISACL